MSTAKKATGSFPIHHLPTELLVNILFRLDGYSLNSTLEAAPQLCRRFVLLTDRQQPALFTCQGLRRAAASEFNRGCFRSFVKLFEIGDEEEGSFVEGVTPFKKRYPHFLDYLDRFCFLHLATQHSGAPRVYEFIHEVFLSGATAEISNCPAGEMLEDPTSELINDLCLNGQRSVIVKGVEMVENLDVPELESLTIVFSSKLPEPVLRNIKLSKKLKQLKIVYYGACPLIDHITITKGTYEERNDSVMEFIHAPSMKTHIQGALPYYIREELPRTTEDSLMTRSDSGPYEIFGTNFQRVNLIGGHWDLPLCLLWATWESTQRGGVTRHLHWKRTTFDYDDVHQYFHYSGSNMRLRGADMLSLSLESSYLCEPLYELDYIDRERGFSLMEKFSVVFHTNQTPKSRAITPADINYVRRAWPLIWERVAAWLDPDDFPDKAAMDALLSRHLRNKLLPWLGRENVQECAVHFREPIQLPDTDYRNHYVCERLQHPSISTDGSDFYHGVGLLMHGSPSES